MTPLSAQNLDGNRIPQDSGLTSDVTQRPFCAVPPLPGTFEVPAIERAEADQSDNLAVFAAQDSTTLTAKAKTRRSVDAVVDLGLLRNPSPYVKIGVGTKGQPYQIAEDSLRSGLARISAVYRESGKSGTPSDCSTIALSVEQRVKLEPSQVLETVEREVTANPGCSCEVVKTAIKASEANVDEVVAIVEAAIYASPESMRIVSQCAIAAMPESIVGVQALLARIDPNAGESGYSSKGAKSGKDAKVAAVIAPPPPNPLDLPPVGPPLPPPPYVPPPVTDVDP